MLTWKLERRTSTSPRAAIAIDHLMSQSPDIVVLTEARTTLPLPGGHVLWSDPPVGTRFAADERKVLIWSKHPWTDVDLVGAPGLDQTRFVSATTATPLGDVRVLGICIPYHMADVTTGPKPRSRPWERHMAYLESLTRMLAGLRMATVIAGDFNQKIPRVKGGYRLAADTLQAAFVPTTIVTAGAPTGGTRPGIDHIAVSSQLRATSVWAWPQAIDGVRMSDHEGAGADLTTGTSISPPAGHGFVTEAAVWARRRQSDPCSLGEAAVTSNEDGCLRSRPNLFGPSAPFAKSAASRKMSPINGITPTATHHADIPRSCSLRTVTATYGTRLAARNARNTGPTVVGTAVPSSGANTKTPPTKLTRKVRLNNPYSRRRARPPNVA